MTTVNKNRDERLQHDINREKQYQHYHLEILINTNILKV